MRIELKPSLLSRLGGGFSVTFMVVGFLYSGLPGAVPVAICLELGFVMFWVAASKRRLVVDVRGVTEQTWLRSRHIGWDDVDHYTYWSINGAKQHQNRSFARGELKIVGRNGVKILIDERYGRHHHVFDAAFEQMHQRLRETQFSPFALSQTELEHVRKGTLGFAEIETIRVGSGRVNVCTRGKRLPWASVEMWHIKNVMLFLETAAERGLCVHADPEVFMPPTVLDKIRPTVIPQARVVR